MRRFPIHMIILCSLLSGTHLYGREPGSPPEDRQSGLSYKLKAGEEYRLRIELQQQTESESIYSNEISLSSRATLLFSVDSVSRNETYFMTVRYQDLLLSMLAPGMDMDINSESARNPILSSMIDFLEMKPVRLTLDHRGQLLSLEGLNELFQSMEKPEEEEQEARRVALETLSEAFGENALQSLLGLFLTIYPVLPSMTNWTNDITYYFNTKPVGMVNRYTLARQDSVRTIIQGLGMLQSGNAFTDSTGMGIVNSEVSGSQTYDIQVDTRSGWPLKCVSRQRLVIETTIVESTVLPRGLKIPSYTETLLEVSGHKMD